ncbi:MAG: glycosyltransferase family 87 protein [bacterium]
MKKNKKRDRRAARKKRMQDQGRFKSQRPVDAEERPFRLRESQLIGLTLLAASIYFAYSFLSDGFYQHDEAGHYLSMRGFWHDPNSILSIWAKPGFKLLYVIPALLGPHAVLLINCLLSAFCCYLAYKIAESVGCRTPLFAFLLLILQPFWLQLSFRNYSELLSALLILTAVYFHLKNRTLISSLAISYMLMMRYELYTLAGLYGLYFLVRKKFVPMFALLTFPLLNHVWGWLATGDPLYLYNSLFGGMGRIQAQYSALSMGFFHFPKMSLTVYGALAVIFFLVYAGQIIFYKEKAHWPILAPLAVPYLQHCVFQIRELTIGPSGAGNLRAIVLVAPLIAVLGAIAIDRLLQRKDKKKLLIILVPYMLLVFIFMKYKHNNLAFTKEVDPVPVLMTLITIAGVFLLSRRKEYLVFLTVCSVGFALVTVKPMKLSPEDVAMKQVVAWAKTSRIENRPFLLNHSMFFYFYGKTMYDFPNSFKYITKKDVEDAPVGAYILWDSHYSYRPNSNPDHIPYTYFDDHKEQFRPVRAPFISSDRRFGVFIYEKIARNNNPIQR